VTYAELIGGLFPRLTGGIRWGLERTERLLAAVGDPQRSFRSLHVGGTNGKGSVSATLAAVLRADDCRVGLYTSPHLCTFRERIQVAGAPISEEALLAAAERLWPAIEREGASFFEATTALAFLCFADAGVETAVVEVGLGGRLDATNVVDPEVVVLTNVAVDHVDYLGATLDLIAAEKAGIIKAGVPVVTGERSAETLEVFRRRAESVGAPLASLDEASVGEVEVSLEGTSFRLSSGSWGELELRTPLIGSYQAWNTALAVRALEELPAGSRPDRDAVVRGVAEARWPGRLQWERLEGRGWIFDVAHNPTGVAALLDSLALLPLSGPLIAVVGILADKDWGAMLSLLAERVDALVLTTPPTAPSGRAWDPVEALRGLPPGMGRVVEDFPAALEVARGEAGEGTVLVTGSFHTVGDALALLGLAPYGTDPVLPPMASGV
jgi:dihydrofolate synthase/folylpolyglutamate synthase